MYTSTFAHRRSTSAEEQLFRMDDGEPENSRGTTIHQSKQPSSLAESQRGCRVRDGGGGKKMERGKAYTVVGAAHHEERRLEAHGEDWRLVEQQPSRTGEEKRERAEQQQPGEEKRAAAARRGEESSSSPERRREQQQPSRTGEEKRERAEQQPPVYILQTLVGQIGSPTTHLQAQSGKPKEGSAQPGRAAP